MFLSFMFAPRRYIAALALTSSLSLQACAGGGAVPRVADIKPVFSAVEQQNTAARFEEQRPAVRRVRLTGDFFMMKTAGKPFPKNLLNAKVDFEIPENCVGNDGNSSNQENISPDQKSPSSSSAQQCGPYLSDLLELFADQGIMIVMGWDDGSIGGSIKAGGVKIDPSSGSFASQGTTGGVGGGIGGVGGLSGGVGSGGISGGASGGGGSDPTQGVDRSVTEAKDVAAASFDLMKRKLPFRRYKGTMAGLFSLLQRSMGLAVWWDDAIYVSPVSRYSVMIPQSVDLMNQISNELVAKGARNVVASMQAGTISFVAPAALAEEEIRPYLLRVARNASEVSMQLALVSVTMNEANARGFDWNQFNFSFGQPEATAASNVSTIPTTTVATSETKVGDLFTVSPTATRFTLGAAKIFGVTRPLDIAGAVKFLSTFGNTVVDQNVELRTLSGTVVSWRSGESIPYVSGVGQASLGGVGGGLGAGGLQGSAQTAVLQTGLNLRLSPQVESSGGLVTVNFDLEVRDLIEFVELSAGSQIGTLTQPRTRDQRLNDIVRIPIGETVVLGGLRRQSASDDRNGPFRQFALGSRNAKNATETLFIVMRPTVTFYEVAGLDVAIPQKLGEVSLNGNQPWAMPSEYRGEGFNGASANRVNSAHRSMAQPGAH